MTFRAIAAMAKNRVIGKGNTLPWHFPEDFKFFKEKTLKSNLIMGRKTYEGMPMPWLPERNICVLTRTNPYKWDSATFKRRGKDGHVTMVGSPEALPKEFDYWVCGGSEIYSLFLPKITEFFVTELEKEYEGDAHMPAFEHLFKQKELVLENADFKIFRYHEHI